MLRPAHGCPSVAAPSPPARSLTVAPGGASTCAGCARSKMPPSPQLRLDRAALPCWLRPAAGTETYCAGGRCVKHTSYLNRTFHLREFRRGQVQPAGPSSGLAGGGQPQAWLNPLFLYGAWAWVIPHLTHAVGNHLLKKNPNAKVVYLPLREALRRRHGQGVAAQRDQRVQALLPLGGCAADRRHPVLCPQGAFPGRVLPHLQRPA